MDPVSRIKITVSFWAVAAFGAVICIDQTAVIVLLCALVHELGHLFACLILNVQIEEFNLTILGFGIVKSPVAPLKEILITAAGPLAGLMFAGTAAVFNYRQIGVISLLLSTVNLIPVPPLDGDRILREVLPARIIFAVNTLSVTALFGFGLYLAVKFNGFTLLLFSLLLFCCMLGKYPQDISAIMFRNLRRKF